MEISIEDDRCNYDQAAVIVPKVAVDSHPILAGAPWLERPPLIGGLLSDRADLAKLLVRAEGVGVTCTPGGGRGLYAASPGGREVFCQTGHCYGRGFARPWEVDLAQPVTTATWLRWDWPGLERANAFGARLLAFAGETLWAADNGPTRSQLLRAGRVVLENTGGKPLPPLRTLLANGENDVVALASGGGTCQVLHWDGKQVSAISCPAGHDTSLVGSWGDLWWGTYDRSVNSSWAGRWRVPFHHDGNSWRRINRGCARSFTLTMRSCTVGCPSGRVALGCSSPQSKGLPNPSLMVLASR